MEKSVKIREVENGYIVTIPYLRDENIYDETEEVIEGDPGEEDTLKRLLFKVAEHFGAQYDKYKSTNLNITFDSKGHKAD